MEYPTYKSKFFADVLDQFETEEMKLYCIDLLEERDEINYEIPSSTSLKYHNKTQCGQNGQILHEIMVGTIMNYILSLDYVRENMYKKPKQRDSLRIAAIMHDCKKTNGGKYTVHEHPELGAQFIEETEVEHDIDRKLKKYIANLIRSHSGQWTTSKKSTVELPAPDTDDKFLVHLCDYLSSRSNLDMIYSDRVKRLVNDGDKDDDGDGGGADAEKYIFRFGKYKGKSFSDVLDIDKKYLKWLKKEAVLGKQEPLASLLKEYV